MIGQDSLKRKIIDISSIDIKLIDLENLRAGTRREMCVCVYTKRSRLIGRKRVRHTDNFV